MCVRLDFMYYTEDTLPMIMTQKAKKWCFVVINAKKVFQI